jgi:hypothetical protein
MGLMRYDVLRSESASPKDLFRAWAYEACRLFRDKLVSNEEKAKFDEGILYPVLSSVGAGDVIKSLIGYSTTHHLY